MSWNAFHIRINNVQNAYDEARGEARQTEPKSSSGFWESIMCKRKADGSKKTSQLNQRAARTTASFGLANQTAEIIRLKVLED